MTEQTKTLITKKINTITDEKAEQINLLVDKILTLTDEECNRLYDLIHNDIDF